MQKAFSLWRQKVSFRENAFNSNSNQRCFTGGKKDAGMTVEITVTVVWKDETLLYHF
jgi:hypothetical protein